jgi:CubicO group peptidase (beta-lactamase class C family)
MSWQSTVRPVVEDVACTSGVPGIVVALACGTAAPDHLVVGTDAAGVPLASDSLFPVASITKLATALAVLRLVAAGELDLDEPLARHLPDATAAGDAPTLRDLLRHTAGLPDDLAASAAPYNAGLDWPRLRRACLATAIVEPVGKQIRYSNVGFGLLAIVVERVTGRQFPAALTELVLAPLGVEGYLGVEPPRPPARIAGDLGDEAGTDLETLNSAFWRSLALPWGGMVATAAGALTLARAFAGVPSGFLPASLLTEATHDQTPGLDGTLLGLPFAPSPWGLGVELSSTKEPHWSPQQASPGSIRPPASPGHRSARGPSRRGGPAGRRSAPRSWPQPANPCP